MSSRVTFRRFSLFVGGAFVVLLSHGCPSCDDAAVEATALAVEQNAHLIDDIALEPTPGLIDLSRSEDRALRLTFLRPIISQSFATAGVSIEPPIPFSVRLDAGQGENDGLAIAAVIDLEDDSLTPSTSYTVTVAQPQLQFAGDEHTTALSLTRTIKTGTETTTTPHLTSVTPGPSSEEPVAGWNKALSLEDLEARRQTDYQPHVHRFLPAHGEIRVTFSQPIAQAGAVLSPSSRGFVMKHGKDAEGRTIPNTLVGKSPRGLLPGRRVNLVFPSPGEARLVPGMLATQGESGAYVTPWFDEAVIDALGGKPPLVPLSLPFETGHVAFAAPENGETLVLLTTLSEIGITAYVSEEPDIIKGELIDASSGTVLYTLPETSLLERNGVVASPLTSITSETIDGESVRRVTMRLPLASSFEGTLAMRLEVRNTPRGYLGEDEIGVRIQRAALGGVGGYGSQTSITDENPTDGKIDRLCIQTPDKPPKIKVSCPGGQSVLIDVAASGATQDQRDNGHWVTCVEGVLIGACPGGYQVTAVDGAGNDSAPFLFPPHTCEAPRKHLDFGGRRNAMVVDKQGRTHIVYTRDEGIYYAWWQGSQPAKIYPIHCRCGAVEYDDNTGQRRCPTADCEDTYGFNVDLAVDADGLPIACFAHGRKMKDRPADVPVSDHDWPETPFVATARLHVAYPLENPRVTSVAWQDDVVDEFARFWHCAVGVVGGRLNDDGSDVHVVYADADDPAAADDQGTVRTRGDSGTTRLVSRRRVNTGNWLSPTLIYDGLARDVDLTVDDHRTMHLAYRAGENEEFLFYSQRFSQQSWVTVPMHAEFTDITYVPVAFGWAKVENQVERQVRGTRPSIAVDHGSDTVAISYSALRSSPTPHSPDALLHKAWSVPEGATGPHTPHLLIRRSMATQSASAGVPETWDNEAVLQGDPLFSRFAWAEDTLNMRDAAGLSGRPRIIEGAATQLVFGRDGSPRIVFVADRRHNTDPATQCTYTITKGDPPREECTSYAPASGYDGSSVEVKQKLDLGELIVATRGAGARWRYSVLDGRVEGTGYLSAAQTPLGRLRVLTHNGLRPHNVANQLNKKWGSLQLWLAESKRAFSAHADDLIGESGWAPCFSGLAKKQDTEQNVLRTEHVDLSAKPDQSIAQDGAWNALNPTPTELAIRRQIFREVRKYLALPWSFKPTAHCTGIKGIHERFEDEHGPCTPLAGGASSWDEFDPAGDRARFLNIAYDGKLDLGDANSGSPLTSGLLLSHFPRVLQEFSRIAIMLDRRHSGLAFPQLSFAHRPEMAEASFDPQDHPIPQKPFDAFLKGLRIRSNEDSPLVKRQRNVCVPDSCAKHSPLVIDSESDAAALASRKDSPSSGVTIEDLDYIMPFTWAAFRQEIEPRISACKSLGGIIVIERDGVWPIPWIRCKACVRNNAVDSSLRVVGLPYAKQLICQEQCGELDSPTARVWPGKGSYLWCDADYCDDTRCDRKKCREADWSYPTEFASRGPGTGAFHLSHYEPLAGAPQCQHCPDGMWGVGFKARPCTTNHDCDMGRGYRCWQGECMSTIVCESSADCPLMTTRYDGTTSVGECSDGGCVYPHKVERFDFSSFGLSWPVGENTAPVCQSIGCNGCYMMAYCVDQDDPVDLSIYAAPKGLQRCPPNHQCSGRREALTPVCPLRSFTTDYLVRDLEPHLQALDVYRRWTGFSNNQPKPPPDPALDSLDGYLLTGQMARIQLSLKGIASELADFSIDHDGFTGGGFSFQQSAAGAGHQGALMLRIESADALEAEYDGCDACAAGVEGPFVARVRFQPYTFGDAIHLAGLDSGVYRRLDDEWPQRVSERGVATTIGVACNLQNAADELFKTNERLVGLDQELINAGLGTALDGLLEALLRNMLVGGFLLGRKAAIDELDVARNQPSGTFGDNNNTDSFAGLHIRPILVDNQPQAAGVVHYREE